MNDCFNGTFAVEESTICVSEISPMIVFFFKMFQYCILYPISIRYTFSICLTVQWISLEFLSIFSYFFTDVHRFSLKFSYDFHRFSLKCSYDFPTIFPWFSKIFPWRSWNISRPRLCCCARLLRWQKVPPLLTPRAAHTMTAPLGLLGPGETSERGRKAG